MILETLIVYSSPTAPTCCPMSIPLQLVIIMSILFAFMWYVHVLTHYWLFSSKQRKYGLDSRVFGYLYSRGSGKWPSVSTVCHHVLQRNTKLSRLLGRRLWHVPSNQLSRWPLSANENNLKTHRQTIHVHVHVHVDFVGYTRCGEYSGQCIRRSSMCNAIQDCVNNWDEEGEQCVIADHLDALDSQRQLTKT